MGIDLNAHARASLCSPAKEAHVAFLGKESVSPEELEALYAPIYELIGASLQETFVLTGSGAESVHQILWSVFLEVTRKEGKTHFIASHWEDAPTMQMLKRLEELGCSVKIAPLDASGKIDLEKLEALIGPRTALLSMTMADGLTGVVQPIDAIAALAKRKGVLLHLDANYAVGKLSFSFSDLSTDYLSFSGKTLHATDSGALFAKKTAPLLPLIFGAPLNLPALAALSAASKFALLALDDMSLEVARLRDLLETLPGTRPLFDQALRLPNTTTLLFPRIHFEALHYYLAKKGIQSSIGGGLQQHLPRLLAAAHIPEAEALTAVSFSLSRMTTEEEIRSTIERAAEVVRFLQTVSEDLF